jgi:hypothetical protein
MHLQSGLPYRRAFVAVCCFWLNGFVLLLLLCDMTRSRIFERDVILLSPMIPVLAYESGSEFLCNAIAAVCSAGASHRHNRMSPPCRFLVPDESCSSSKTPSKDESNHQEEPPSEADYCQNLSKY